MAPRQTNRIAAPLAEPPRISLLRSVQAQDVSDQLVGYHFEPESCGQSGTGRPEWCPGDGDNDKPIPDNPPAVFASPFYVWAGDKCSTFGSGDRDWQGRARRQLEATQSYQVAHELWTGAESLAGGYDNLYLASPDADEVTDGATSVTDGLARLEQALADCRHGQRGAIHLPPMIATHAMTLGTIRREGNNYLTVMDTFVIVDAGYDGSAPDGTAPSEDSVWAYATGIPVVQLAPVHVLPDTLGAAMDRRANTIEYRAERQAAVGWDGCCHLAAEFDVGWPTTGGS